MNIRIINFFLYINSLKFYRFSCINIAESPSQDMRLRPYGQRSVHAPPPQCRAAFLSAIKNQNLYLKRKRARYFHIKRPVLTLPRRGYIYMQFIYRTD